MSVTPEQLDKAQSLRAALRRSTEHLVVANQEYLDLLLISLLAEGHVLLDGDAGTGKTFLATTFAAAFDLIFRRIQMSPDLMPMDILGWEVHGRDGSMSYQPDPIYCNFLLADQLNYAPPKLQSSLFEVMEERTVTVKGISYQQLKPFMTCATTAPTYEQNADYPIVTAQLDRFLMRLTLPLPDFEAEVSLILRDSEQDGQMPLSTIAGAEEIIQLQTAARDIRVDRSTAEMIAHIMAATRKSPRCREYLHHGLTPRAAIMLKRACQARALIHGCDHVTHKDVAQLAIHVLAHRLVLNFNAEAEGVSPADLVRTISEEVQTAGN
jgi:MoxR-like ATPase